MEHKSTYSFEIDHLDPLGQGVSKKSDKVSFIPKTLKGETGEMIVLKDLSKIQFCQVSRIDQKSPERINPECIHFEYCGGCHYQHTSYTEELNYKHKTLQRIFPEAKDIKIHAAQQRLHYRNRVQLHYDLSQNLLGLVGIDGQLVPVPFCKIGHMSIQEKVQELYQNNRWRKLIPANSPKRGHVEIFIKKDQGLVELSWNQAYSFGGFTQVNSQMNQVLKNIVQEHLKDNYPYRILELFSGDGNLTKNLKPTSPIIHVDYFTKPTAKDNFISINLFGKNALKQFTKTQTSIFDFLLLDPPRSGFKELKDWSDQIKPHQILYVSCNPQTLKRDLNTLTDYTLETLHLIDLFPSTYHFETVAHLKKNFYKEQ